MILYFYLSSSYSSTNIHCISEYLKRSRPDLKDIRYTFVQNTYDNFVESNGQGKNECEDLISPDLIAILNCGFIFYDSWNQSIPYLFKFQNIPVIFTEYHRKDSESNLQKVEALGKNRIQSCHTPSLSLKY